jgi:hypothetical protein
MQESGTHEGLKGGDGRSASGVARDIATAMLIAPIRLYQLTLSPMMGNVCRYTPSCSRYAVEAIRKHGPVKGLSLAARRILRCNPWHEGGWDPVPEP